MSVFAVQARLLSSGVVCGCADRTPDGARCRVDGDSPVERNDSGQVARSYLGVVGAHGGATVVTYPDGSVGLAGR
jgi:hypothetical protein